MEKTCELLRPLLGQTADARAVGVSVLRMINLLTGMLHIPVTEEQLMELNAKLHQVSL